MGEFIRVKNEKTGAVVTMAKSVFEDLRRRGINNHSHLVQTDDPISYSKKRRAVQVSMNTSTPKGKKGNADSSSQESNESSK